VWAACGVSIVEIPSLYVDLKNSDYEWDEPTQPPAPQPEPSRELPTVQQPAEPTPPVIYWDSPEFDAWLETTCQKIKTKHATPEWQEEFARKEAERAVRRKAHEAYLSRKVARRKAEEEKLERRKAKHGNPTIATTV